MENELDKQTAVDYYSNKIGRITSDLVTGKITGKQFVMLEIKLLDTAKQMEKQQHKNTWTDSRLRGDLYQNQIFYYKSFNDYFKLEYGGKDGE